MRTILFAIFLALIFVAAPAHAQTAEATLYVNATYDIKRDPAKDLTTAITRATAENKRILVEVGGEWCTWCHALDKFLHANADVTGPLAQNFVVVKVNFSEENKNEAFLSKYPEIPGYPHIFVLEKDGTLLHSQSTGDLEEGRSYSKAAWTAFIEKWKPAAATAQAESCPAPEE